MTAEPLFVCRDPLRRAELRRRNEAIVDATQPRWTGIDLVEFESSPQGSILVVYLLCPFERTSDHKLKLKASDFKLWDEKTRQSVNLQEDLVSISASCLRLTPVAPLCTGRVYRLELAGTRVDPQYRWYRFTAMADVADVDPKPAATCPPPAPSDFQPNYLARDYASFRQLILDRLRLLLPEWQERHVPDVGMTLVELLAYVGDYLSYYQDAVGTEAYLHTARQRVSVRRHARLVDYTLHEGSNARTFVQLEVVGNPTLDPQDAFFITQHPDPKYAEETVLPLTALRDLQPDEVRPFEVMATVCKSELRTNDLTNVVGLIGVLVSSAYWVPRGSPAGIVEALKNSLSPVLRAELQEWAATAVAPPPRDVVLRLVDSINDALAQQGLGLVAGFKNAFAHAVDMARSALAPFMAAAPGQRRPLFEQHNGIEFYTWSGRECCLPVGATRATLKDGGGIDCDDGAPLNWTDCDVDTAVPATLRDGVQSISAYVMEHLTRTWNLQHLKCGDYLLLEERIGPVTHEISDADPEHRQVVQLTRVCQTVDPVTCQQIVEIEWHAKDALRFPLCLSSVGPPEKGCQYCDGVSVARGNVLLVDHGKRIDEPEWLGMTDYGQPPSECSADEVLPAEYEPPLARQLRPRMQESGLTFASSAVDISARSALAPNAVDALPCIEIHGYPKADEPADSARSAVTPPPTLVEAADLESPIRLLERYALYSAAEQRRVEAILPPAAARFLQNGPLSLPQLKLHSAAIANIDRGETPQLPGNLAAARRLEEYQDFVGALRAAVTWHAKSHLLSSGPRDQHVVVEIDDQRRPRLRFGDDDLGRRPPNLTSFYATYRVGSGVAGNIGADGLRHVVFRKEQPGSILRVRNPMPASGGVEPESLTRARLRAPYHFKQQQRAIIAEDYAELVRREFGDHVQQAHATLHWTGAGYEANVVVDPNLDTPHIPDVLARIAAYLNQRRRIGHRVRLHEPRYVGLRIDMIVCVAAGHLRAHVKRELLERFSNRVLSDGTRGFFHADNFTFGNELYSSQLVVEAKRVAGVENVDVTRFERRDQGDSGELEAAVMKFGPLEIPRLDNDPNQPEFGALHFDMRGER